MTSHFNAEKDAQVRMALAESGDDGHLPRPTSFYFYGGDITRLKAAATAAGYQIKPTIHNDGVVLESVIAVDKTSFEVHSKQMEAWAEEFGCEYDGWECEVVTQ